MMSRIHAVLTLLAVAGTARAQQPQDDGTSRTREARTRFQAGVAHAQGGDLAAALGDFEAAYSNRQHFSVLYNIGQAQLSLGHVVEAIDSLERYLRDGGEQIAPDRRREVEVTIAAARARTGTLVLEVPAGTEPRVWLDGGELPPGSLNRPLTLSVGRHTVLFSNGEGFPRTEVVELRAQGQTSFSLKVAPAPLPQVAQLRIRCAVPDVDIEVGATKVGRTPLDAPLVLSPGRVVVRLSRPGYRSQVRELTLRLGTLETMDCDRRELRVVPTAATAQLAVAARPMGAVVTVDGERYTGGPLVPGRHDLIIAHEGFVPLTKSLLLLAGEATRYDATLSRTKASEERARSAASKQRFWGGTLGFGGLAFTGAGIGVLAWNSARFDEWSPTNDASTAASIQRADDAAIGLVAVGGALAGC